MAIPFAHLWGNLMASFSLICSRRMVTRREWTPPTHTHTAGKNKLIPTPLQEGELLMRQRKKKALERFVPFLVSKHPFHLLFQILSQYPLRKLSLSPLDPVSSKVPCLLGTGQPCDPNQANWKVLCWHLSFKPAESLGEAEAAAWARRTDQAPHRPWHPRQ